MNKIFDTNRFGRYLAYDLHNLRANYGLSMLLLSFLPVVLYLITVLFNVVTHGLFGSWQGWVSPPFEMRIVVFFTALFILTVSMPIRQYGALTDKQYGSDWLMIPASRTEKFISMLLVTLVIVPLVFLVLYNLTDWILSVCDPTYGQALVRVNLNESMFGDGQEVTLGAGGLWLLWSGIAAGLLIFLLGGLCFKRKKAAKTFLCLFALSFVLTGILSVIAYFYANSGNIEGLVNSVDPEKFQHLNWNFRINFALWTRLVVILGGLGAAIWFRLKTLKH